MSWFEIINKQVDMGELMARIRAEQAESESNKEQERREKSGLPEEDIEDGVKLNWIGRCPKCKAAIWKGKVTKGFDPDFNPRRNTHNPQRSDVILNCPYFKKAGKVEGKHGGATSPPSTTKETKDVSAADECPMAAPTPKNYYAKTIQSWQGPTSMPEEIPNPDYDSTKGERDI